MTINNKRRDEKQHITHNCKLSSCKNVKWTRESIAVNVSNAQSLKKGPLAIIAKVWSKSFEFFFNVTAGLDFDS